MCGILFIILAIVTGVFANVNTTLDSKARTNASSTPTPVKDPCFEIIMMEKLSGTINNSSTDCHSATALEQNNHRDLMDIIRPWNGSEIVTSLQCLLPLQQNISDCYSEHTGEPMNTTFKYEDLFSSLNYSAVGCSTAEHMRDCITGIVKPVCPMSLGLINGLYNITLKHCPPSLIGSISLNNTSTPSLSHVSRPQTPVKDPCFEIIMMEKLSGTINNSSTDCHSATALEQNNHRNLMDIIRPWNGSEILTSLQCLLPLQQNISDCYSEHTGEPMNTTFKYEDLFSSLNYSAVGCSTAEPMRDCITGIVKPVCPMSLGIINGLYNITLKHCPPSLIGSISLNNTSTPSLSHVSRPQTPVKDPCFEIIMMEKLSGTINNSSTDCHSATALEQNNHRDLMDIIRPWNGSEILTSLQCLLPLQQNISDCYSEHTGEPMNTTFKYEDLFSSLNYSAVGCSTAEHMRDCITGIVKPVCPMSLGLINGLYNITLKHCPPSLIGSISLNNTSTPSLSHVSRPQIILTVMAGILSLWFVLRSVTLT